MSDKMDKRPIWQAEAANPETCAKLRTALREVKDPELGLDIVQLGMIRDVQLQGNHALIKMILTTPFCPYGPAMMEAARAKAAQALGIAVNVELGDEAWENGMMEEGSSMDWGIYP
jgi:metal-sulfur cluster biosynthetic enzyme